MRPRHLVPEWVPEWLPLAGAWVVWLGFFVATAFDGFSLREDGYLAALAERVVQGDVPYRDFSYIRPPLPVFIQAVWLRLIPGYGIAAERWYFALEVGIVLTVVALLIMRTGAGPLSAAAAALGGALVAFTAGFAAKPWHTVDGILFSVVAAWALVEALERRVAALALAAGLAAAAAALCKQGFALVALVGLALTLLPSGRRAGSRPWSLAAAYTAGVAALGAAVLGYLVRHGALGAAVDSVVLAPRQITRGVFQESFWGLRSGMHLPSLIGLAVGVALLGLLAPRVPAAVRIGAAALVLGGVAVVAAAWPVEALYHVFVLEAVYSAAWIGGALALTRLAPAPGWTLALALATLYASTWSYVALRSAGLGLALALPFVLLTVSARRAAAVAALLVAGLAAAGVHVATRYQPAGLLAAYTTEGLHGIRSRVARTRGVDAALALVVRETAPGDPVFAFMDFPALYLLSARVNPTRVDWFLPEEVTAREVARAVADLEARPPRRVIVFAANPRRLADPRLAPVWSYLAARYEDEAAFGELRVLRPRAAPEGTDAR